MAFSPQERRELKDLADQLVAATESNTYWLGRVRETSIELRDRLNDWLDQEPPSTEEQPDT